MNIANDQKSFRRERVISFASKEFSFIGDVYLAFFALRFL